MKRWFLWLLAACMLSLSGCATDPGDEEVWPDEQQIRDNANKSHGDLRKEERKR
jgi:cytochrome c biogenesis protein ResB